MKTRMTSRERREQLLGVAREVFAERGYEATSIEEIASRAKVSKPIVYEHFGGKEGLHAVVIDRETKMLLERITASLAGDHPKRLLEQAAVALLSYVEEESDGFRILVRDAPGGAVSGMFASVIGDIASQVEHILGEQFKARGYKARFAPLYAQALVGMVAQVGQWWLDERKPDLNIVAAHLVNLAWNGLSHLEPEPGLSPAVRRQAQKKPETAAKVAEQPV